MISPDASTRDRLLDAAMALFARQGYASTSIADG
jgi:AcrR family transcriptional regulator